MLPGTLLDRRIAEHGAPAPSARCPESGQIQSSRNACVTSGLPLTADMRRTGLNVGFVPIRDKVHRSERALFDRPIGESTRVLAPPLAHGTDDRAEVATFCGEDVLGPRGTHRIEASLDDAILLKRPQTLR
jgi:hypothetical protein